MKDRIRFTLEDTSDNDRESVVDVYPTDDARKAFINCYVWTSGGGMALLTLAYIDQEPEHKDIKLWLIRQDEGEPEPWPLEDAMRGGKRYYSPERQGPR